MSRRTGCRARGRGGTGRKDKYTTEAEAKTNCRADTVVWVNSTSKVYHASSSRSYGKTKTGAYMCEKESAATGFRAAKLEEARQPDFPRR